VKIYCIYILILGIILLSNKVQGQTIVHDSSEGFISRPMTEIELSNYRQSIWDNLPAAVGWVNDFGELFKNEEENALESLIEHFEKKTGIEIMLVTVDTNMVARDKLKDFSERLLTMWGIGKIRRKNGIVICICKGYEAIEISSGFGIDKFMNHDQKLQILQTSFIPYYQKNSFYEGTLTGLKTLISQLSGENYSNNVVKYRYNVIQKLFK